MDGQTVHQGTSNRGKDSSEVSVLDSHAEILGSNPFIGSQMFFLLITDWRSTVFSVTREPEFSNVLKKNLQASILFESLA